MTSLIIYDNTGAVVTILGGMDRIPSGVQGILAEVPAGVKSAYVDVVKKEAHFELYPNTESEVTNLQDALIELEERVSALEG